METHQQCDCHKSDIGILLADCLAVCLFGTLMPFARTSPVARLEAARKNCELQNALEDRKKREERVILVLSCRRTNGVTAMIAAKQCSLKIHWPCMVFLIATNSQKNSSRLIEEQTSKLTRNVGSLLPSKEKSKQYQLEVKVRVHRGGA